MAVTPKEIRQEAVTLLATAPPLIAGLTAANVHDSRTTLIPADDRPALDVSTESGDSEGTSAQFARFTRTVRLMIRGYSQGLAADDPDYDADLSARSNDLEEAVRARLLVNQSFIGGKRALRRISATRGLDNESGQIGAVFELTLEIDVDEAYDPDLTGADNLATIDVDVDMLDPAGTVDTPDSSITIEGLDL